MNSLLIGLNVIFTSCLLLMFYYVLTSNRNKLVFDKYYFAFILIIALSLIYKLPFDFSFFHGLEYEDSYLANSVSRYLMYNRNNLEPSYLATTCGLGSLDNCMADFKHSGNLIGLSAIVVSINELFGYRIENIAIVNLIFSIISALSIFIIGYKLNDSFLFGIVASLIFITTPILNSYHTSSLFETSSSSLIVISLLVFILYSENKDTSIRSIVLYLILIFINIISIHFKRENIIIISFPFILLFIKLLDSRAVFYSSFKELIPYLLFLVGLSLYYIYILDIPYSLKVEQDYAMGNSFQFKFFLPLFTMFVKGFSTFRWFYFFGLFIIVGFAFILSDSKKHPILLLPLIIFLIFIFVDSIHHRSYYFVRSGSVTGFDSLRHINTLSPFFSIVSGYGIYKLIEIIKRLKVIKGKSTILIYLIVTSIFVHLLFLTYNTRNDLIKIEQTNRILPISELLNIVDQNKDIVITDQSILLHNYCQSNLTIIEFTTLGNYLFEEDIKTILKENNIYFLRKDYFNEKIFRNRYMSSIETLEKFTFITINEGEGFEILMLTN